MKLVLGLVGSVLVIVAAVAWSLDPDLTMPDSVREKYSHLFKLQIETLPDGSKKLHNGRLWDKAGLKILSLKGDRFEMAYQHGRLLKDYNAKENLEVTGNILARASRNMYGKDSILTKLIVKGTYQFITEPMLVKALDKIKNKNEYLGTAWGLSEGSGATVQDVFQASFGPSSIFVALGLTTDNTRERSLINAESTANCSGFSVWGDYTKNKEMILGRNTDYPLTGYYDKYATVIYFHPTDGAQRFMALTSAGFHNAGVTGMNESGIFIGTHTVPTTEVSRYGQPILMVGQEVLRRAKTLDEAIAILSRATPASGWTYFVVSSKEKKGISVEITADNIEIVRHTDYHYEQANHFVSKSMSHRNLAVNSSVERDSIARKKRLRDRIVELKGRFTKESAMELLGEKVEAFTGKTTAVGNVVGTHFTVSSIVVVPLEDQIYVATGSAPVSLNPFLQLPVVEKFDPSTFSKYPTNLVGENTHSKTYPLMAKAEKLYIEAKNAYEYRNDVRHALSILDDVVKLDTKNQIYWFVLGILRLKNNDYVEAVTAFDSVIALDASSHRGNMARYYRARSEAVLGDAEHAATELAKLLKLQRLDSKLRKAVQSAYEEVKNGADVEFKYSELGVLMHIGDIQNY